MTELFQFQAGLMPSRSWLEHHYLVLGKTQKQIAAEVGCHWKTVSKWVRCHKLRELRMQYRKKRYDPGRDWLYHNYIELDKTVREIATELECSAMPITCLLYTSPSPRDRS